MARVQKKKLPKSKPTTTAKRTVKQTPIRKVEERIKAHKDVVGVASMFKAFKPARDVLRKVRAVPTIFPQFDHAVGVGGLPLDRFMLVHGPSNMGKTVLANGFLLSMLRRGHFGLLIDAEQTTPITWLESLMGEMAYSERFFAERPTTYEQTVDLVRHFAQTVERARAEGLVGKDTSALIVVDSIRKLVPANLMKKILESEGGVDGMNGRAAQIKAAMNAAWLDELIPLLARTETAMLAIARESEDANASDWARAAGTNYKVGGGKAIYYDSSLVMRAERAGFVYAVEGKADERGPSIGERIRVTITKTKVAQKEDRFQVAYFHLSNGTATPVGFDMVRDLVELGERFGVIHKAGAWLQFGPHKWQGRMNAIKSIYNDPQTLSELDVAVRARFMDVEPLEHDSAGVVYGDGT
jgi:RecA/RadA recombinase